MYYSKNKNIVLILTTLSNYEYLLTNDLDKVKYENFIFNKIIGM